MLSPEQLHKIEPSLKKISNKELIEIRDSLYELGQLMFDDWLKTGNGSKYPTGVLSKLGEINKNKAWSNQSQKPE